MSETPKPVFSAPPEQPKYDFNLIAGSLGLFPLGFAAINPSNIVSIDPTEEGATINMLGDIEYELTHEQLAGLDAMIRARIEEMQRAQVAQGKASSRSIVIPDFVRKGQ